MENFNMLLNKKGQSMEFDGKNYYVGMQIFCNEASVYSGLTFYIFEQLDRSENMW